MKRLTTRFLSVILTLSMVFTSSISAFADENYSNEETADDTQEDIDAAREAYVALTPEAKAIFDESLTYDPEMLEFHTTYVDQNFTPPAPRPETRSATTVADPMRVLMTELNGLGLPSAVLYSLKAMGASMAASIADGPLPIGDIMLAAATASTVVVIATNWNSVSPKFNQITRAFQKAFSTATSNISSAFAKIKSDAKKEVDKKDRKEKKPTGNRVKDVQNRLKKEGFEKTGQTGSHEKWKKGNKTVTVPNHGPNHEIPIGTLRNIWRQAGWI